MRSKTKNGEAWEPCFSNNIMMGTENFDTNVLKKRTKNGISRIMEQAIYTRMSNLPVSEPVYSSEPVTFGSV